MSFTCISQYVMYPCANNPHCITQYRLILTPSPLFHPTIMEHYLQIAVVQQQGDRNTTATIFFG